MPVQLPLHMHIEVEPIALQLLAVQSKSHRASPEHTKLQLCPALHRAEQVVPGAQFTSHGSDSSALSQVVEQLPERQFRLLPTTSASPQPTEETSARVRRAD